MSSTPAGWYDDPGGTGQLRYWDGTTWTDHYAPRVAAPPPPGYGAAPPPSGYGPVPTPGYPGGPPPSQGMSGCLKAFLIALGVAAFAGVAIIIAVVRIGGSIASNLDKRVNGSPGRPATLAASESSYNGERKQDIVAGPDGVARIGPVTATATNWSRTTNPNNGLKLICGDVTVTRVTVNPKDHFDAVSRLLGDVTWQLVLPSGTIASFDTTTSSFSSVADYLVTNQIGNATGKICFADPDPTLTGRLVVTWQPRLFRPERAVWLFRLP